MAIDPLPQPAKRGDAPEDFSEKTDTFLTALPPFAAQANALRVEVEGMESATRGYRDAAQVTLSAALDAESRLSPYYSAMDAVIGNATNINTVAVDIANVNAAGENIADINAVVSDMADIKAAPGAATTALAARDEAQSWAGQAADTVNAAVADVNSELSSKADKITAITAGTGLSGGGDLAASMSLDVLYGAISGTAAQGNDERVVNALRKDVANTSGSLGFGSTSGTALDAERTIELATNAAFGGIHENHTGIRLAAYGMTGWGNAKLGLQISTNWKQYGPIQEIMHEGNLPLMKKNWGLNDFVRIPDRAGGLVFMWVNVISTGTFDEGDGTGGLYVHPARQLPVSFSSQVVCAISEGHPFSVDRVSYTPDISFTPAVNISFLAIGY
ncbi:MAG: hypothetical protein RBR06_06045 [Desulfuromonadaceae bacterium]|nr:hypothetical protein [Desulfuromonadaceae bacterium]